MNPLVSIIIPTYNRAHLIFEALDSVLAQTYTNWECIIVDDRSIDNTDEVMKKYLDSDARFNYYKRPEYKLKGPSSCRNFGLEKSKGAYVVFLDSDDLISNFCIQKRIEFAQVHSDKDFWIFKTATFKIAISSNDKDVYNIMPKEDEKEEIFYLKLFYEGRFPFVVMSPLWSKKALKLIGGFDENLRMLEDPEMHLRAFKDGLKSATAFLSPVDNYYRVLNTSENTPKRDAYKSIAPESHYYLLNKHLDKNILASVNKYKQVYSKYVFNSNSFFFNIKMIQLGRKNKLLTNYQIILSFFILFHGFLGLNRFKNLGGYSLRNKFVKKYKV